jgi:hypothetical protein
VLQRGDGSEESVHAKYVLGCDGKISFLRPNDHPLRLVAGARSWVRNAVGLPIDGDETGASLSNLITPHSDWVCVQTSYGVSSTWSRKQISRISARARLSSLPRVRRSFSRARMRRSVSTFSSTRIGSSSTSPAGSTLARCRQIRSSRCDGLHVGVFNA